MTLRYMLNNRRRIKVGRTKTGRNAPVLIPQQRSCRSAHYIMLPGERDRRRMLN
jgi:hypothetical protein